MNLNLHNFGTETAQRLNCSRTGCQKSATAAIEWRNPKIHTPERKKVWLACAAHSDFLRDFVAARGFLLRVTGVDEL
ncbi:MAG: hypothetical protein Q4C71_05775 [Microbacteriaceae bacterium]|nr:hypothetical protein [Microbacteriaceae bacterium]